MPLKGGSLRLADPHRTGETREVVPSKAPARTFAPKGRTDMLPIEGVEGKMAPKGGFDLLPIEEVEKMKKKRSTEGLAKSKAAVAKEDKHTKLAAVGAALATLLTLAGLNMIATAAPHAVHFEAGVNVRRKTPSRHRPFSAFFSQLLASLPPPLPKGAHSSFRDPASATMCTRRPTFGHRVQCLDRRMDRWHQTRPPLATGSVKHLSQSGAVDDGPLRIGYRVRRPQQATVGRDAPLS